MADKEKIVLIDGHSILNRAFYGIPVLTVKAFTQMRSMVF